MIDDDLRRLNELDPDHALDQLESDIWRGVLGRAQQRRAMQRMAFVQSVIMAVALLGSVAAGVSLARAATPTGGEALLPSGLELAPSTLLLGSHR